MQYIQYYSYEKRRELLIIRPKNAKISVDEAYLGGATDDGETSI